MRGENLWFRGMEEHDLPAVTAIGQELFSRPWSFQAFSQALGMDTIFIVALYGNTIVGYCGMYCSLDEGEITNVAVAPLWQNQKIGRRMMEYLLGKAAERGILRAVLEVRVSNEKAIHLYGSLGFQNCGVRRNFYEMPREDGMVMVLDEIPSFKSSGELTIM